MGDHADDALNHWVDRQFYYDEKYNPPTLKQKYLTGEWKKPHKLTNGGFQVGDIVSLPGSTSSPAVVTKVDGTGSILERVYISNPYKKPVETTKGTGKLSLHTRSLSEAEETNLNNLNQGEDKMTTTPKLYEATQDGKTRYATKVGTNSDNQWVMEEKGTGTIFTADKSEVEEVMPYTISIEFADSGKEYSYFAAKDVFTVGDFYLTATPSGWSAVRVTKVNTRSRSATKEFKPFGKLSVDKIEYRD